MRPSFLAFFLFIFTSSLLSPTVSAQLTPLTQPEFVKMLYAAERDPAKRTELIEAVRERGIGFVLTDGLRSLTRTKGKNNAELRSVVEEADRRRADPGSFQKPTLDEAAAVLAGARTATLAALEEMPDFVVKQLIQRSAAYAGTGTYTNQDRLVVGVSYRSTGEEEYRVLSRNGVLEANPESKRGYEQVGGTSSTGEFVTMLATVFRPESETQFDAVDSDVVRGRKTITYDFVVAKEKARQTITCTGITAESTNSGIKGRIWIDRENFRVLRVQSQATDIPEGFPCTSAKRNIDYDWTSISDERYLLPSQSVVSLTFRQKDRHFESRNVIRFRDYQKFGTEVKVVEADDVAVEPEQQP
jgi:hypothetical protein